MPAEKDPREPNALTQSLQLTCSLMPSSTVPSTRLVIIWLKRCFATSVIEPALESAPVGQGGSVVAADDVAAEGTAENIGLSRFEFDVEEEVDVEVEVDVDVE